MNASGSKALVFGAGNPSVILHGVNNMKASWTGAPDRLYNTVGIHYGVQVSEIVWDPTESKRLYMAGSGGYVWRSEDGGAHWRTILSLEQIGGPR